MDEARARLIRVGKGSGPSEIELADLTTVGRGPANTMQLLERPVSKTHAEIRHRPGTNQYMLKDLGSRNGTHVNGVRTNDAYLLRNGDSVRFGITSWLFAGPEPDEDDEAVDDASGDDTGSGAAVHATMQLAYMGDFPPVKEIADNQTLREDYEKLRLAYTLSGALHGQADIVRMCDRILEHIFQWLKVDRGVVLLVDPDKIGSKSPASHMKAKAVRIRPGVGWEQRGYGASVPKTIVWQAANNLEAVLSSDAMADSRFNEAKSVVMQGIRSSMTVPLIANDRVLGALHVDSLISTGLFGEKDLSVLGAVARTAAMAFDNVLMQQRIKEETAARQSLSRMLSPNLVDQIVEGRLPLEKGGQLRRVTVLFADVRGFTSLTEVTPPAEMVAMMNDYFERVTKVIFAHEGTLDKYIGDAVMALWGAPISGAADESQAVWAAIGMQRAIDELNADRAEVGKDPIGVGIGIATGELIAGYMGSTQTLSYTVLGRMVNLAARLCGKADPGEILLAPSTWESVKNQFEAVVLDPIQLKGIVEPVRPMSIVNKIEPKTSERTAVQGGATTPFSKTFISIDPLKKGGA